MKRKAPKFLIGALLLSGAIFCVPNTAHATFMAVGTPQPANSWYQGFDLSVGAATVEAFITFDGGGGPFEGPNGIVNIAAYDAGLNTLGDWTSTLVHDNYAVATGSAAAFLTADLMFIGDELGNAAPVAIDILLWSGAALTSDLLASGKFVWENGVFNGLPTAPDDATGFGYARDVPSVPDAGGTFALLGLGLLGLSSARRKTA